MPTMPCAPGGSPVPSVVRLIDVLEGNPVRSGPASGSEARNGASLGVLAQQLRAQPVDQQQRRRPDRGDVRPARVPPGPARRAPQQGGEHVGQRVPAAARGGASDVPGAALAARSSGRPALLLTVRGCQVPRRGARKPAARAR